MPFTVTAERWSVCELEDFEKPNFTVIGELDTEVGTARILHVLRPRDLLPERFERTVQLLMNMGSILRERVANDRLEG